MAPQEVISLIGVFVGLGAFISGYIQYVKAQKWKRAEFVAKEIKEFEARPKVKLAMQLLDWNVRKYDIGDADNEKDVVIHDGILEEALRPHDAKNSFNPTEVFIRDIFDSYFDSLERFNHFVESGLVTPEEFRPYLKYWIEILGDINNNRKPEKCREAFWTYLDFYGYTGVINLLSSYGFVVKKKASG